MTDSPNAARVRRHRARRACGIRVVPVELSVDAVEALIEAGILEPNTDAEDQARVVGEFLDKCAQQVMRYRRRMDRDNIN